MAMFVPRVPSWSRRKSVLAAIAILGVAVAAFFAFVWGGRGAETVPFEDALSRFRDTNVQTVPANVAFAPDAGVYEYRASGSEKLSVLGASQRWGDTVWGTVSNGAGECWDFSVLFNTHHTQVWRYCGGEGTLLETGGESLMEFDFGAFSAKDRTVFTCEPPGVVLRSGDAPGASTKIRCEGHSTDNDTQMVSSGTLELVARTTVRVGGESVDAFHVRSERTMSGDQRGRERTDRWFAVDNGLLLKLTRDISVVSKSILGDVRYTERGTIVVASLTPRR
jgi:hypothetical protein